MSFFPAGHDPRDYVFGALDLCEIDTPDGACRFVIDTDGVFIDISGNAWWGSQLISVGSLAASLDGAAPAGEVTLSFFQDPDASNLIEQIRALGSEYVSGRSIRFFVQPLASHSELYQPSVAPIQWLQRTMRTISYRASGAQDRSITLSFEAWSEDRRAARRIILNTEGHAALIGEANPSLEFMPTDDFEEQKLFG